MRIAEGYCDKENVDQVKSESSGPVTRSKSAKVGGSRAGSRGAITMNKSALLRQQMLQQKMAKTGQVGSVRLSKSAHQIAPSVATDETSSVGSSSRRGGKISSKIGSLANVKHKPGGGDVKIHSRRQSFAGVKSKCGTFQNVTHTPGGGNVKITRTRLSVAGVQSKVRFTNIQLRIWKFKMF